MDGSVEDIILSKKGEVRYTPTSMCAMKPQRETIWSCGFLGRLYWLPCTNVCMPTVHHVGGGRSFENIPAETGGDVAAAISII